MKDLPIIFSAPMVRALLAGTKTQTRRVLKPQPPADARYSGVHFASGEPDSWFFNSPRGPMKVRERYAPGDRLYVREAWGLGVSDHGDCPRYRATMDYQCGDKIKSEHEGPFRWRSPIHMPRWASRITLTVTEVRVQRLQEISEADAQAEGGDAITARMYPELGTCRHWFQDLWNSLHGPDAWDANPWVVAISFTVALRNIDAEGAA